MMNSSLRFLRIFYFGTYLLALAVFLVLNGIDCFGDSITSMYVINLVCVLSTLLGCYIALSQPQLLGRLLKQSDTQEGQQHGLALVRVLLFSWLLIMNTAFYCLAAYANTPKYCVLISLVLGILVYPKTNSPSNSTKS